MNETNSTAVRCYYDVPIMALTLSFAQIVFRLTVVSVGLLLNGVVLMVVSCSRQLRYPRHIFWGAVALVDCLFLAQCVLELAVIVNHDHLACAFNVLLAFTDYSILLLFLCLAALDRYLAIVQYERYKRSVTNRATVTLLSCTSAVTFAIITSPFWTGHRSVHTCTINLAQMYWVFAWNSLLAIFCVSLHVVIFVKSKTIIRRYFPNRRQQPPITLNFVKSSVRLPGQHSANVEGERQLSRAGRPPGPARLENPSSLDRDLIHKLNLHGDDNRVPSMHHVDDTDCLPWMHGRSIVSRMEARAAVRMSVNVLPLWLCTFPISCTSMAIYWCIRLGGNCDTLGLIMSYLRDVFLLHSVYNPVMYMCTSCEFWRALKHIAWKLKIGCQTDAN